MTEQEIEKSEMVRPEKSHRLEQTEDEFEEETRVNAKCGKGENMRKGN